MFKPNDIVMYTGRVDEQGWPTKDIHEHKVRVVSHPITADGGPTLYYVQHTPGVLQSVAYAHLEELRELA